MKFGTNGALLIEDKNLIFPLLTQMFFIKEDWKISIAKNFNVIYWYTSLKKSDPCDSSPDFFHI